tara:strand:- start:335 stop:544 length:210 start_codon:yes stop_codon:yes gene_type:complete
VEVQAAAQGLMLIQLIKLQGQLHPLVKVTLAELVWLIMLVLSLQAEAAVELAQQVSQVQEETQVLEVQD